LGSEEPLVLRLALKEGASGSVSEEPRLIWEKGTAGQDAPLQTPKVKREKTWLVDSLTFNEVQRNKAIDGRRQCTFHGAARLTPGRIRYQKWGAKGRKKPILDCKSSEGRM
jgi:hypothetical protein